MCIVSHRSQGQTPRYPKPNASSETLLRGTATAQGGHRATGYALALRATTRTGK